MRTLTLPHVLPHVLPIYITVRRWNMIRQGAAYVRAHFQIYTPIDVSYESADSQKSLKTKHIFHISWSYQAWGKRSP